MLRVAMPNKGSLAESAAEIMKEAGYRGRRESKELVVVDADNDVELFFLRPRDIAVYVGSGTLDVGITGRDLLLDSGAPATERLELGFGTSTFRYAARPGVAESVHDLAGKRIATSFEGLVEADLAKAGVEASVVRLDGAVETAVTLGVADVIADVVETGTTLRNAGLEVFGEPILHSEAVLIRPARANGNPKVDVLVRRLQGVLTARDYVMLDYDIRADLLEQASAVTPGLESPTVSPLHDPDYVAVRAMVPKRQTNALMDQLYDLGARAILVTDIAACRL
ncbi:ATP phosphoribosyltransferase [Yimella sp. cx-51]|uniref:ATP phosphoribosyltransferase n=1 Tax=Yimella sp. cx-51 TaxID=2770551 RepID=UPI00165E64C9|nr:ATP phosphoribosyltransferase [Yimella sp. cx-51]MBC9957489.1 ATP phosphoribosyltransferase [Yimella sp. cx-51]QTH39278.1 ATP phosphoribosyltransferase [Yimella sp. cx-51]